MRTLGGAERAEGFERGMHEQRIGVDAGARFELDEIGLEHDAFAPDIEAVGDEDLTHVAYRLWL